MNFELISGLIIAAVPFFAILGLVVKVLKKVKKTKLKFSASGEKNIRYVIDGDTVIIDDQIKIRIANIDAPEMGQPGGQQAKDFINKILGNAIVTIKTKDVDVYGRVVATIIKDNKDVALMMLENGFALTTKNAPSKYKKAEKFAQNQKRGIWKMKNFQNPKEWRQQNA